MELEHFGMFLKRRREARGLTLAELSRATKIKETSLELLEEANIAALPAQVFVRGFVCAYAREVGADELEALRRYRAHLHAAGAARPAPVEAQIAPHLYSSEASELAAGSEVDERDGASERRRFGVVMVVLLVLVVATLTLSLLLHHGRAAGPGLSLRLEARPGPAALRT